jgi:hypothetical protein
MQIEDDVPHPPGTNTVQFHRQQLLAERLGWVLMTGVLIWALIGGFGDGGISHQVATSSSGDVAVEYQRFARCDAPTELFVNVAIRENNDELRLHLRRAFTERVRIENVTPEPYVTEVDAQGLTLVFKITGPADYPVKVEYRPQSAGQLQIGIDVQLSSSIDLAQFVYP